MPAQSKGRSAASCDPQPSNAGATTNSKLEDFGNESPIQLFKTPDGLPPDWQHFFKKVVAYHEKKCAKDKHYLTSMQKRSWYMQGKGISEFEMLVTATEIKETGDNDFKNGRFQEALLRYINALFRFAKPDIMNNMAACALKLNRFDFAEEYSTNALDMDLLSSPGATKAYLRRATARLHLAKFETALQDANAAHTLSPDNPSIKNLLTIIRENIQNVKTQEDMANYLKKQPQPPPKIPITELVNWARENDIDKITKLPAFVVKDMIKFPPPTF